MNSSGKDDRDCEKRRLIFQEASSLGSSFHFSDRKPALLRIPSMSLAGSWLFCKFVRSFFQEADFFLKEAGSFTIPFSFFAGTWLF